MQYAVESADPVCRVLTTAEDFAALAGAWEELFQQCSYPSPFCTWEWAWHWWQDLGVPDLLAYGLRIVTVTSREGRLLAIAPFYFPTRGGFPLRLRPLRLLGTRIRCRGEDITDEPVLLLRAGNEQSAIGALLSYLMQDQEPGWDITHLRLMRRREAPGLAAAWADVQPKTVQPNSGRTQAHLRSAAGQYVILPDSWAAFRGSLSKSMRDNLAYYPRLLTRHGHDWAIRTVHTPTEVADAADVLIKLHHQRACSTAGAPHHNHLPSPLHTRFLRAALTALAVTGRARVVLLEIGGVPVAAQAVLEADTLLQFHYSGFDPEWRAYSPITILNAYVMEEAIARGVHLADYLPESEPWKTRWAATDLYVMDELSWIPLKPRPMLRMAFRSLVRLRQRWFGPSCDCGFCRLPLTQTETSSKVLFPVCRPAK